MVEVVNIDPHAAQSRTVTYAQRTVGRVTSPAIQDSVAPMIKVVPALLGSIFVLVALLAVVTNGPGHRDPRYASQDSKEKALLEAFSPTSANLR